MDPKTKEIFFDIIEEQHRRKRRKKLVNIIMSLILGGVGTVLLVYWYDWKLMLAIFILMWSNNISQKL